VSEFPRTMVGGVSMPRLICGTNWMLGFSHFSAAKDRLIRELFDTPSKVARVLEVFVGHGCNAVMSMSSDFMGQVILEAQQKTGVPIIWVATPSYPDMNNPDTWKQAVEHAKRVGATFCFPHTSVTDRLTA